MSAAPHIIEAPVPEGAGIVRMSRPGELGQVGVIHRVGVCVHDHGAQRRAGGFVVVQTGHDLVEQIDSYFREVYKDVKVLDDASFNTEIDSISCGLILATPASYGAPLPNKAWRTQTKTEQTPIPHARTSPYGQDR